MLKFAAVDVHGRESSLRLLTTGAMLILLATVVVSAQRPSSFDELLPELVAKIASVVPSGTPIRLSAVVVDPADNAAELQSRAGAQLSARGIRPADANPAATAVSISCGANLRERVCLAAIRGEGRDQIAVVTRPLLSAGLDVPRAVLALELQPLVSQQSPILDAAIVGERLIVLDVAAVTVYEQRGGSWQPLQSRSVSTSRTLPRDPRGRLRVAGGRIDVFLPGAACTGRLEPLEIACSDRQQAWPLGIENGGLEPGLNFFKTPEGLAFYNVAPLDGDGPARSLVADREGSLRTLNGMRAAVATVGTADDVVSMRAACVPGTVVLSPLGRGDAEGGDMLRVSRLSEAGLVPVAAPVNLPGALTALWAQPDLTSAIVVTHDAGAGRYDALRASLSCSR